MNRGSSMRCLVFACIAIAMSAAACTPKGAMVVVNNTSTPVAVTVGGDEDVRIADASRDADSSYSDGAMRYQQFDVKPGANIVVAAGLDPVDGDTRPAFDYLAVTGPGIAITARGDSILSVFDDIDGNLFLVLRDETGSASE